MTGVLIKGGHLDTDMHTGRMPRENWRDPAPAPSEGWQSATGWGCAQEGASHTKASFVVWFFLNFCFCFLVSEVTAKAYKYWQMVGRYVWGAGGHAPIPPTVNDDRAAPPPS